MLAKKKPGNEKQLNLFTSPSTRAVATQFNQPPQTTQTSKSANTAKRLAILKVLAGNVPLPIAIGQLLWKSRKNHPRAQSSVKHLDVFVSQLIIYQHTLCLSNYSSRLQLQNSLRIKIISPNIANRTYRKGVSFLSKMVYKRVKGGGGASPL